MLYAIICARLPCALLISCSLTPVGFCSKRWLLATSCVSSSTCLCVASSCLAIKLIISLSLVLVVEGVRIWLGRLFFLLPSILCDAIASNFIASDCLLGSVGMTNSG